MARSTSRNTNIDDKTFRIKIEASAEPLNGKDTNISDTNAPTTLSAASELNAPTVRVLARL